MDELVETMSLRLQQLKETARDRVESLECRDVASVVTRERVRPNGTR